MRVLLFLALAQCVMADVSQDNAAVMDTIVNLFKQTIEDKETERSETNDECNEAFAEMDDRKHELHGAKNDEEETAARQFTQMERAQNDIDRHTAEKDTASANKARVLKDLSVITAVRNEDQANYLSDNEQLEANINALEGASNTIQSQCHGSENFLQLKIEHILPKHLTALLQQKDTKGSGCEALMGMLEELRNKFDQEKGEADHENDAAKDAFEVQSGSLEDESQQDETRITNCNTAIGDAEAVLGDASAAHTTAKSNAAAHAAALADLAVARKNKQTACDDTNKHLTGEINSGHKGVQAVQGTTSFLQTATKSTQQARIARSMTNLAAEGKRLNSAVLLSVVEQSKGGEFDQILSKLSDLADKLRTQNADEIAAQAECLQEMSNNEAERKKATQASLAASQKEIAEKAKLGTNQAQVRRNKNRIQRLQAKTKKYTDSHAEATAKNNKISEVSNQLLTQVVGGLEQLQHIQGVEVITNSLGDVKTKCEEDLEATKARQHDSDAFLKTNKDQHDAEITTLTAENEDLELANAQLTEDIADTEADRHVQQESLNSFLGIFRDVLNKKCVANKFDPVEQFDQRNAARQAEIDALGTARATLRGD